MKNINLNVMSNKNILSSIQIVNKCMNSFYKLTNVLFLLLLVFGSCGVSFGMEPEKVNIGSNGTGVSGDNLQSKGNEIPIVEEKKEENKVEKKIVEEKKEDKDKEKKEEKKIEKDGEEGEEEEEEENEDAEKETDKNRLKDMLKDKNTLETINENLEGSSKEEIKKNFKPITEEELESDNGKMAKLSKIQAKMKGFIVRKAIKLKKIALGELENISKEKEFKDKDIKQEEIAFILLREVTKEVISKLSKEQLQKIASGNVGAQLKKLVAEELCKLVLKQRRYKKIISGYVKKVLSKKKEQTEHNRLYKKLKDYLSPGKLKKGGEVVGQGDVTGQISAIEPSKVGDIEDEHLQGPPYYTMPKDKDGVNIYGYEDALSCVNGIQKRTNEFTQKLLSEGEVIKEKTKGGGTKYHRDMGLLKVDNTNREVVKNVIRKSIIKDLKPVCSTMYSGLCEGALQNSVFSNDGDKDSIFDNSASVFQVMQEGGEEEKVEEDEKEEIFTNNSKKTSYNSNMNENENKKKKKKKKMERVSSDNSKKTIEEKEDKGSVGHLFKGKMLELHKISRPSNNKEIWLNKNITSINREVREVNKNGKIVEYLEKSKTFKSAMNTASLNTRLEALKICMREMNNSLEMIRLYSPYYKSKQLDGGDQKESKKTSTIVQNPERVLKAKMFTEFIKMEEEKAAENHKKKKKKGKEKVKKENKDNKKGDLVISCDGKCPTEVSLQAEGVVQLRIPRERIISYKEENAAKEEEVSVKEIADECADDVSRLIQEKINSLSNMEVDGQILSHKVAIEDTRCGELKNTLKKGGEEFESEIQNGIAMHCKRIAAFMQAGLSVLYSTGVNGEYYPFPGTVDVSELANMLRDNGIIGRSDLDFLEKYMLFHYNKLPAMIFNPDISDYQKRNYGYKWFIYSSLGFVLNSVLSGIGGEDNSWMVLSSGNMLSWNIYMSNIFTSFGINAQITLPMPLPLIGGDLNIHVVGVNFLSLILGGVIFALLPLQRFDDEVNIMIDGVLNSLQNKSFAKGCKEVADGMFKNDAEQWLFKEYNKKSYKGKFKQFFKWCFERRYSEEREYLGNNSFLFVLARRCLFDTLQLLSISIPVNTYMSINVNFGTLLISWLMFGGKNNEGGLLRHGGNVNLIEDYQPYGLTPGCNNNISDKNDKKNNMSHNVINNVNNDNNDNNITPNEDVNKGDLQINSAMNEKN